MKLLLLSLVFLLASVRPWRVLAEESQAPEPIPLKAFKGSKTPDGICVEVQISGTSFAVELPGKIVQPVGSDRLEWEIDGRAIQLTVARYAMDKSTNIKPSQRLLEFRSWDLRSLESAGWKPDGPAEPFNLAGKGPGLRWILTRQATASDAETRRYCVATINQNAVVMLTGVGKKEERETDLRLYLEKALATSQQTFANKQEPKPPATRRPKLGDPDYKGESVEASAKAFSALTGKPAVILLNESLMTLKDRNLTNALSLKPDALLEFARFAAGANSATMISASVFDGQSGHAVSLMKADADSDTFEYFDPWGTGSYLEKEHNEAKVAAWRHPAKPRVWLVKGEELERVLYAITLLEEDWRELMDFAALLDEPSEALSAGLQLRQLQNPADKYIAEDRLRAAANYLQKSDPQKALKLCKGISTLYPASALATKDLAEMTATAEHAGDTAAKTKERKAGHEEAPLPSHKFADVVKDGFFTFFNLKEVSSKNTSKPTGRVVLFKSGGQFRPLTGLSVTVSAEGLVTGRSLTLMRSFIDDGSNSLFARDFAKSHLIDSVDLDEQRLISHLVNEIWDQSKTEVPIPGARRPEAKIPVLMSPGYVVFLGRGPAFDLILRRNKLSLRNEDLADGKALIINVQRIGP
jgi:hypothetical protein